MEVATQIKIKMTPKDFFLYIGTMVTLYISVFSFIALLFQYIEFLLPDTLNNFVDPYASGVRLQMASLIVVFPVYIFLTRLVNGDMRMNPDKKNLGIRRWLIYLTLFAAGATVLVDLVVLLNTFLGGELTLRFILKVVTVFIVVGAVFFYYFFDLKSRWEREGGRAKAIAGAAGVIVLVSIISGFFIMGSPQTQRLLRFDQQKISDLQNIQWQIVNYWQQKGALPKVIADLEDPISGFIAPTDAEGGESYTYSTTGRLSFNLCATFNREGATFGRAPSRAVAPAVKPIGTGDGTWDHWEHGTGEVCFERTIDPDLYPKRPL